MHRTQRRISLLRAAGLVAAAALIATVADRACAQTVITPQREKKQFTDARNRRRILQGRLRRRIPSRRPRRSHPQIRSSRCACSSTTRARPDRRARMREVIADIGRRIEHIDIAEADAARGRERDRHAGARSRPAADDHVVLRRRPRARDQQGHRSAVPVELHQGRQLRHRLLERHSRGRCRQLPVRRLRL